jgi:hypothetical protein
MSAVVVSKDPRIVFVEVLPDCDFCGEVARFDSQTTFGSWANCCSDCLLDYGVGGLGIGLGQMLVKVGEVAPKLCKCQDCSVELEQYNTATFDGVAEMCDTCCQVSMEDTL